MICLGEVLFDCIADQPGLPLEQVTSWTSYPGGAPANVATALCKLGDSTALISCVGEDAAGRSLVQLLETIGVAVSGVQSHPTAPTRTVLVLRSTSGDRQFVDFGDQRNSSEFADTYLQAGQIPTAMFEQAAYLVIGTIALAYPDSQAALYRTLALAEQFGVKVVLDVNWRPVFWENQDAAPPMIHELMPRVKYLKMAEEEAAWLFDTTDPSAIAARLPHLEGILVTAGEQGCAYWLAGNAGKVPAFAVDVEDTTGAGDSFLAGFLHRLLQQEDWQNPAIAQEIVRYASAAGALTTMRAGAIAAQPTPAEINVFLFLNQQGQANGD